jgi:apolipoprotein D and lipocalin family protein
MIEQSMSQNTQKPPLMVVPEVDVTRYMGTWYEIARLPNSFQDHCAGDVTATYTLLEDGDIEVLNQCKEDNGEVSQAKGKARRAGDDEPSSKLEVRFAPAFLSFLSFVWGNYWVIDLAPDYSYAVVGEPNREYLWILSRTPTMEEVTLRQILDRAKGQGYELAGLIRTKQTR